MWVSAEGLFEKLKPYVTITALHFATEQDALLSYRSGTRDKILTEIDAWAQDFSSPPILCLTGPIGSGKSVIVREIASLAWERAHLVGEFFFWVGDPVCTRATTFAATLAYHLGFILPSAAQVIRSALDSNPSVLEAPLENQWESLIIKPLERLDGTALAFRPLFIIDGIDGCSL
ncbi:hypothetical protein AX16_004133 [Volvariella volvacea WC 439]|nr:hypothetical protein AX16_004133 [Volvariella volvacea WC 439]